MHSRYTSKIPLLLVLLITLAFAKLQANKRFSSVTDICMNICSDGRGYYAWLPAAFIYHDLNFSFFNSAECKAQPCGGPVGGCLQDYRNNINGRNYNKYYPGTAVMMLPFFSIAHIIASLSGSPANGYSPPYFLLIGFAGIFYYLAGMLLMLGIFKKLGLSIFQRSMTVLLISFGTNIIYYSIDKPAYSHIYSFVLIAAFIYCALCLRESFKAGYIFCLSLLIGLIFITRPVNISILILLPFILKRSGWRQELSPAHYLALLPGLVIPAILLLCNKIATGALFVYSYGKESFDFFHPHFWQFLFHYDNGLFPYAPLLLMPFLLIFLWYKSEMRYIIIGACLTLLITAYIHSSWWCWDYGFGFGARTMLDFVPLFGVIIGMSVKEIRPKNLRFVLPLYFLCCVITMVLYDRKNHGFMSGSPVTDYWPALYSGLGIK